MKAPTSQQVTAALRWWQVSLCDMPAMPLYTDEQTIADMLADNPSMTASPIQENALPGIVAHGQSDPIHGDNF